MKLGRWSTIAGNNNATPPDGWPEGQAPSTVNDCARENMAAIRTAFSDLQFFDQDFTPTALTSASFSVPGNQTSAIHAGRRLKLFDAQTIYATVSTASFTTVTTIHVETDGGATVTSSLSSFGISVLSNSSNGLPRNSVLTVSAATVLGTLSVSATASIAVLQAKNNSITCVAAGGFICTGDVTAFSDERLKTDWRDLPDDYLERLAHEVQFGVYTRTDSGHHQVGCNANQLQPILPEGVHGALPNYLSVAYGNVAMVTVMALLRRVLELERRLNELTK